MDLIEENDMRHNLAGVLVTCLIIGGCAAGVAPTGPSSQPARKAAIVGDRVPDIWYLPEFTREARYDKLAAELHGAGLDISPEARTRIEEVFDRDKASILKPLLPYARAFDGKRYPAVAVGVYGVTNREAPGAIVYHVGISGTLKPRGRAGEGDISPAVSRPCRRT